jgi:hypothetical protein
MSLPKYRVLYCKGQVPTEIQGVLLYCRGQVPHRNTGCLIADDKSSLKYRVFYCIAEDKFPPKYRCPFYGVSERGLFCEIASRLRGEAGLCDMLSVLLKRQRFCMSMKWRHLSNEGGQTGAWTFCFELLGGLPARQLWACTMQACAVSVDRPAAWHRVVDGTLMSVADFVALFAWERWGLRVSSASHQTGTRCLTSLM